ncbi:methylglyoxal synthase [Microscilla marina]|uniref:Methylglyoxal synthase n=1 Tax=Microscilla marina ATCC 23134 TaxID=313606 RepID=A1ZH89_MICM2|nr:methylglyoxal synthase [Microscilla marina]EAY30358.1 methylglyoxal synthase [Microscilla marina ATCC 23134]
MKKIAIIAHDGRKPEMVHFLKENEEVLTKVALIATGTTGTHVAKAGYEVEAKLSGPMGGDAQIAAMAAEKQLCAVIFFRDPLGKHPHEPDVQMLMRICDLYNIPLATNPASAGFMLKGMAAMGEV